MVIRCKVGKFEFDDQITTSMAKLIRDTVMGGMLAPKDGAKRLKTANDIEGFIHSSFPKYEHLVLSVDLARTT